jgi:hypothetical protein
MAGTSKGKIIIGLDAMHSKKGIGRTLKFTSFVFVIIGIISLNNIVFEN